MGLDTFHYLLISAPDSAQPHEWPLPPFVHLHLQTYSSREGKGSHLLLITEQLATEGEVDGAVARLKRDLDRAGNLAKAALKRAQSKDRRR